MFFFSNLIIAAQVNREGVQWHAARAKRHLKMLPVRDGYLPCLARNSVWQVVEDTSGLHMKIQ